MDIIDTVLLNAWNRLAPQIQHDRVEALRRARRTFSPTFTSPVRAACLCIRSSDSRINTRSAAIELDQGAHLMPDHDLEYVLRHPHEYNLPHTVWLESSLIRKLTAPIFIPWPGVPTWRAARVLGLSKDQTRRWMTKGFLRVSFRDAPSCHGKRGKPIPIVYTPSPIDPANFHGRTPESVWGTLWQVKHNSFPENFVQPMRRVPRFRTLRGAPIFRGWDWLCPGRLLPASAADDSRFGIAGESNVLELEGQRYLHIPCNRRCHFLYAPLPIWTLPQALNHDLAIDVSPDESTKNPETAIVLANRLHLCGTWHPGFHNPAPGQGCRTFACKHCWSVRGISLSDHRGWNEFVTHITGGLLFGHEVPRPLDAVPKERIRRPFTHQKRRPTPRRDQVLHLLLRGFSWNEIAQRMGIKYSTVNRHVTMIYKRYDAHTRKELVKALLTRAVRNA